MKKAEEGKGGRKDGDKELFRECELTRTPYLEKKDKRIKIHKLCRLAWYSTQ